MLAEVKNNSKNFPNTNAQYKLVINARRYQLIEIPAPFY